LVTSALFYALFASWQLSNLDYLADAINRVTRRRRFKEEPPQTRSNVAETAPRAAAYQNLLSRSHGAKVSKLKKKGERHHRRRSPDEAISLGPWSEAAAERS
jgi:hypothetical protein